VEGIGHAADAASSLLLLLGQTTSGGSTSGLASCWRSVLREIATTLTEEIRSHDNVSRYGGAVLAVILPRHAARRRRRVAEKLVSP